MLALGLETPPIFLTTVQSRAFCPKSRPDGTHVPEAAGVSEHCSPLCTHHSQKVRAAQNCMTQATISTETLEYPFACTTCVKNENQGILVYSDGVHMLLQACAQQNSAGETAQSTDCIILQVWCD